MLTPELVNSLGLALDIIGVFMLWRFGLPPDVRRSGQGAILLEGVDEAEIAKAARYDFLSRCAMWLIVAGFLLQMAGNWVKPT